THPLMHSSHTLSLPFLSLSPPLSPLPLPLTLSFFLPFLSLSFLSAHFSLFPFFSSFFFLSLSRALSRSCLCAYSSVTLNGKKESLRFNIPSPPDLWGRVAILLLLPRLPEVMKVTTPPLFPRQSQAVSYPPHVGRGVVGVEAFLHPCRSGR